MWSFVKKAIVVAGALTILVAYLLIRQGVQYTTREHSGIIKDVPPTHETEKAVKRMGYITTIKDNTRVMVGESVVGYVPKRTQFKVLDYRHGWYLVGLKIGKRTRRGWIKDSYVTWHIQDRAGMDAPEEFF